MAYARGQSGRRMRGVTLVELMVGIAIVAIVMGVAVPDFARWAVDGHIRNAAGRLQQDMQWARVYALRTNEPVYMQIEYQDVGGQEVCSWVDTLTQPAAGTVVSYPQELLNGPRMSVGRFQREYANVSCTMTATTDGGAINATTPPGAGTPYDLAFYPDGTIWSGQSGATALATGNILFEARTDAARYAHWDVKYSGAGELRSCVSNGQSGQGIWPCALQ